MKLHSIFFLVATSILVTGCGSDAPKVIGANDPEGMAAYEAEMAATNKSPEEIREIEKSMSKQ
ncbi:hypothetical protein SAMN06265222_1011126 [Neorhodopirellula lusitana]|uniref:Secreted protein n=1 Tax=Neorhodopirellula lusitana TaxID=445327 RepID=A0ABY1PTW5_9BACT|nr:hypothetical protein [Neorhodopirellula lusitana]SMP44346.1 hypothetical protein SAMN06265222_1011126 [Neorhodopirellula lusitana]